MVSFFHVDTQRVYSHPLHKYLVYIRIETTNFPIVILKNIQLILNCLEHSKYLITLAR